MIDDLIGNNYLKKVYRQDLLERLVNFKSDPMISSESVTDRLKYLMSPFQDLSYLRGPLWETIQILDQDPSNFNVKYSREILSSPIFEADHHTVLEHILKISLSTFGHKISALSGINVTYQKWLEFQEEKWGRNDAL